jgi:hypothetical protein
MLELLWGRRFRLPTNFALLSLALLALAPAQQPPPIVIDYPQEGSIFPPDFAPPTFLWRDSQTATTAWELEIAFSDGAPAMRFRSRGEPMNIGEIDRRCIAESNQLPKLTPEQAPAAPAHRSTSPLPRTPSARRSSIATFR